MTGSVPVPLSGPAGASEVYRLTRGTLIAAAVGIAVAQLAVAIPAVLNGLFQQDLNTTSSQLTWISDAFLVPVTLLELTFGVLGDLFGRKRLLIIGGLVLAIGAAISAATPTTGDTGGRVLMLWCGQIVAGIGAAAIMPTTLAMIAAGTHTAQERSRGIAIWAAALATGAFLSPVLAGWLATFPFGETAYASWHWAFIALVVLGLASAAITLLLAKNSSSPQGRSLDWPGQITIAIAVFALLFAVIQGSTDGWTSPEVVGGFVLAIVFLALFIVVERRSPAPLLRLEIFASRQFSVAAIATVIGMFAYLGTCYATSIRLANIQGLSPLLTSVGFIFINCMTLFLAPVVSRVLARYNPRWAMAAGFAGIGIGNLWMSAIPSSNTSIGAIALPLLIVGTGFAFALSAITSVAVNTVPTHLAGMASGATSLLRDFGFTLGPAVIGSIALSSAAAQMRSAIAASPALQKALAEFNASADHAPAAQRSSLEAAIAAVNSGPLGANSVPATTRLADGSVQALNPLKDVAFAALDSAYSLGFLTCGIAALVAALLAAVALGGAKGGHLSPDDALIQAGR